MVRPAETIRREIDSLTAATVSLAEEFRRLYTDYLDYLGVAARRQMVMATYHLCTQIYPENFLALSVTNRENLQREVRRLGQDCQAQLGGILDPAVEAAADSEVADSFPSLAGEEDVSPAPPLPDETSPTEEDPPPDDTEAVPLPTLLRSMVMAALAEEMEASVKHPLFTGPDMTPTRLAKQHIFLEQHIRRILQHFSKQVNQHLQSAQVLPNLPEAVLDAASEAEVVPMRGRAVPNVLSVLVAMPGSGEEDGEEDSPDRDPFEDDPEDTPPTEEEDPREGLMTHLAAVNLRLADLEFGDVQASMGRSKLRTALGHLRKLGKQYQKVQRELAIAEAEQAWRAIWYED